MAGIVTRAGRPAGRPRKHQGGWDSANGRIYLSTETLVLWRRLRSEYDFMNDNAVAVFLLERNKALTELSQRAEENRWTYRYRIIVLLLVYFGLPLFFGGIHYLYVMTIIFVLLWRPMYENSVQLSPVALRGPVCSSTPTARPRCSRLNAIPVERDEMYEQKT